MFARGLLDKIGVKADFIQIGEYKGADEALTRTAASEQLRGEMTKLADSLYGQIVAAIAEHRHLKPEVVKGLIDEAIIPASRAKEQKLVDHLVDMDEVKSLIAKSVGRQVELVRQYGVAEREAMDLSNPFSLLKMLNQRSKAQTGPTIGLVYVDGVISEGDGEGSLFSEEGTGDGYLRKAMRLAERDDDIKAIVVRISSPGGSALASETAWQAVRRVAAKKPVIISVGGMAASGGYYIASAGDTIFADPTSIVGSIGVVGGKMVLRDLYAKIGITTETFSRGANAGLFSSDEPFTPGQRQLLTNWMKQTYKQFTERVMTTRTGKIKDIDQVAKGRIFLAAQAKDLGMVDRIGGLDQAIAFAANKADLEDGEYELQMLPAPRTLADLLAGHADTATSVPSMLSPLPAELQALPPMAQKAILRQIAIGRILERRPVVLISPWMLMSE
jgi:protease IV